MTDALMNTYARHNVTFAKGEGVWLYDTQGKRYLDALAGVATCSLGHAHPGVAKAICEQANTLMHTSNHFRIALQEQLGEKLVKLSGMDKVFFGNSGAEANEAAIKIARMVGHKKNIDVPHIIVTEGSFHGRTLATLSATGNRKVQAGFEPLVHGFVRVPFNDIEAIKNVAKHDHNVVAILVEPVQGEGGVNIPDADYLTNIRKICDEHGWLMMLDEIQTGMGRTGKWFGYQHTAIKPDVMTLAKALGNGMPIGACLARGAAAEAFGPGNHGTTFGGNPLACAVGLAVIDAMEKDKIIDNSAKMGKYLLAQLQTALGSSKGVVAVRGQGMIIGIELDRSCATLVGRGLKEGLIINVTADKVIRLIPPLIFSKDNCDQLVKQLTALVQQFLQETPT